MFRPMKKVLCVLTITTVLTGAYVMAAPPAMPEISKDLLDRKQLLSSHQKKVGARITYWVRDMLLAQDAEQVVEAREKLLEDYKHYKAPSYQNTFAAICTKIFVPTISEGKNIRLTDPLREVKLVNVAIALCDMSSPAADKSYYAMIKSDSPAMRYLGWKGLRELRGSGLGKAELIKLFKTAEHTLKTEKNSNVLSMVFQTLNFTTSDTETLSEKYRKAVAGLAIKTITPCWSDLIKQITATQNPEDIFNLSSAISTLTGSVSLVEEAQNAQAVKMIMQVVSATVNRFEKLQASITLIKKKIEAEKKKAEAAEEETDARVSFGRTAQTSESEGLTPQQLKMRKDLTQLDNLAQACKILLVNCEYALNSLTGKEESFFASQMTVSDAQAAAMKMAMLEWNETIKANGK